MICTSAIVCVSPMDAPIVTESPRSRHLKQMVLQLAEFLAAGEDSWKKLVAGMEKTPVDARQQTGVPRRCQ